MKTRLFGKSEGDVVLLTRIVHQQAEQNVVRTFIPEPQESLYPLIQRGKFGYRRRTCLRSASVQSLQPMQP